MTVLVVAHLASTLFMVGMIWTVQILHYPLFAEVSDERFVAYERAHSVRITALIALPWAMEGLTTGALLVVPPPGVPRWLVILGAALAVIPVVVTVIASIPAHRILGEGFDAAAHARLVSTNWLRTLGWSAHGIVATWITVLALQPS